MSKKLNRRDFIKSTTAATAGVATIASGISLTTFAVNDNPVTKEKRCASLKRWLGKHLHKGVVRNVGTSWANYQSYQWLCL
jgi:hypothetical protein